MEKRNVFDFENENYSLTEAVENVRENPEYTMWFVDKLTDYDIARVIVKEWDRAMTVKKWDKLMEGKHEK